MITREKGASLPGEEDESEQLLKSSENAKFDSTYQSSIYIKMFKPDEVKALTDGKGRKLLKDLKIPLEDLERALATHQKRFWAHRILNYASMMTIPLYLIFQAENSRDGVEYSIVTIFPGTEVPVWFSSFVGISTSIMSALLFGLAFSSKKEAAKSTLRHAHRKTIQAKTPTENQSSCGARCDIILDTSAILFNLALLNSINITGAMTSIVSIFKFLEAVSSVLAWSITILVLFLGRNYNGILMNESYYTGLPYLRAQAPRILKEIREKNLAVPFQLFFQGLSASSLRALLFYHLAELSNETLGFWLPKELIVAYAFLNTLIVWYPSTHHLYTDDKEEVTAFINNKIKPRIDQFKQSHLEFTDNELEKEHLKQFMQALVEYKCTVQNQNGRFFVFKSSSSLSILIRAILGGWLGFRAGEMVNDETITAPLVFAIAMAGLLGYFLYRADADRLMYRHIREINAAESKESAPEEKAEKVGRTFCESASDKSAFFINIVNCVAGATFVTGYALGALGNTSAAVFIPLVMILGIEANINRGLFMMKRVEDTLRGYIPVRFSSDARSHDATVPASAKMTPTASSPGPTLSIPSNLAANNGLFAKSTLPPAEVKISIQDQKPLTKQTFIRQIFGKLGF